MDYRSLKKDVQKIFKAALKAADGYTVVRDYLTNHSFPQIRGNLFLIGVD